MAISVKEREAKSAMCRHMSMYFAHIWSELRCIIVSLSLMV